MVDYAEEQALEVEALQAIFVHEGELTIVNETEFTLNLVPFPDDEEENHVGMEVYVKYPDCYPEVAPLMAYCACDAGLSDLGDGAM